eukprot:15118735-Alexandrium_andersonii.AAC.1
MGRFWPVAGSLLRSNTTQLTRWAIFPKLSKSGPRRATACWALAWRPRSRDCITRWTVLRRESPMQWSLLRSR